MSRVHRVFVQQPLSPNQMIALEGDISHYLLKVLRLKPGAKLTLFNGDDHTYSACITDIEKKKVLVNILDKTFQSLESSTHTHLGQALTRGEKMDFVLQKATELGVSDITLLSSEFTSVKFSHERLEKKMQHWQKVITSACEQCERNVVPTLHPVMPANDWLLQTKAQLKLMLHPTDSQSLNTLPTEAKSVALAIGPEGGFSQAEHQFAEQHKWHSFSLGPRILRLETATIVALSLLGGRFGDLG